MSMWYSAVSQGPLLVPKLAPELVQDLQLALPLWPVSPTGTTLRSQDEHRGSRGLAQQYIFPSFRTLLHQLDCPKHWVRHKELVGLGSSPHRKGRFQNIFWNLCNFMGCTNQSSESQKANKIFPLSHASTFFFSTFVQIYLLLPTFPSYPALSVPFAYIGILIRK